MSAWVKGLDLSFSRTSRAWWRARYTEGYRIMVQCLWTGGRTPAQASENLRKARLEGFITNGYTNVTPWAIFMDGNPPSVAVAKAIQGAGTEWSNLTALAIDVEIKPWVSGVRFWITEQKIKAAVHDAIAKGKKTCIYSARWAWTSIFQEPDPQWPWLKDYRIWNAFYDKDPDLDFGRAPWGPWGTDDVMGEQYQGTTRIDGVDVDLNVFDPEFFGVAQEEEMALTDSQRAEVEAIVQRMQAPYTAAVHYQGKIIKRSGLKQYQVVGTALVHVPNWDARLFLKEIGASPTIRLADDHPIWQLLGGSDE